MARAPSSGSESEAAALGRRNTEELARGGLVEAADKRLRDSAGGGAWTSDLSVAELALIRRCGFEPLGLVMGTTIYQINAQWGYSSYSAYWRSWGGRGLFETFPCPHRTAPMGVSVLFGGYQHGYAERVTGINWEHVQYRNGVLAARDLAMSRLSQEAMALNAHGIVGVRVLVRHVGGAGRGLEFTVIGTAVHRPGAPPVPWPFTCHLSGQGFAKLLSIGLVPTALVFGIGVVECDPGCGTEWLERSWSNVELAQFSRGIAASRRLADEQMRAAGAGGEGIVGVELRFQQHHLARLGGGHLYETMALGTAVRRFAVPEASVSAAPLTMVRLSDRASVDLGGRSRSALR